MRNRTHEQQHKHNQELIPMLASQFNDWKVTIMFYSALHCVESYLDTTTFAGIKRNHFKRKNVISKVAVLRKIYGEYDLLQSQSEKARYDRVIFDDRAVAEAEGNLKKIEDHLTEYINI